MNPIDTVVISQNQFSLLQSIIYSNLPKEFCLKQYLGWDDATIKSFLKDLKKDLKKSQAAQKKRELSCGVSSTCCSNQGKGIPSHG